MCLSTVFTVFCQRHIAILLYHLCQLSLGFVQHTLHAAPLLSRRNMPNHLLLLQQFLNQPLTHSKSGCQLPNRGITLLIGVNYLFSKVDGIRFHGLATVLQPLYSIHLEYAVVMDYCLVLFARKTRFVYCGVIFATEIASSKVLVFTCNGCRKL